MWIAITKCGTPAWFSCVPLERNWSVHQAASHKQPRTTVRRQAQRSTHHAPRMLLKLRLHLIDKLLGQCPHLPPTATERAQGSAPYRAASTGEIKAQWTLQDKAYRPQLIFTYKQKSRSSENQEKGPEICCFVCRLLSG